MDNDVIIEKYTISKDELNGLLFMFYNALYILHHEKGLKYHHAFKTIQKIKEIGNKFKDKDIDEYLDIIDDESELSL